jgi:hypothetical protein
VRAFAQGVPPGRARRLRTRVGGAIPLTAASSADRGSDDTSGWAGFLQTGD